MVGLPAPGEVAVAALAARRAYGVLGRALLVVLDRLVPVVFVFDPFSSREVAGRLYSIGQQQRQDMEISDEFLPSLKIAVTVESLLSVTVDNVSSLLALVTSSAVT